MEGESGAASPLACVTLPERLDSAAAEALKALIAQARDQAGTETVALDASGVGYVGGLCLQVLLASGCPVVAPSEKIREAFALFGVSAFLREPLPLLQ